MMTRTVHEGVAFAAWLCRSTGRFVPQWYSVIGDGAETVTCVGYLQIIPTAGGRTP